MLPFVEAMRRGFPNSELTWITSKGVLPILEGLEGVRLLTVPKIKSVSSFLAAKAVLKKERFDILLAMHPSFSANLLYPLIQAPRKIGFDKGRSLDGHAFFINERIAPSQKEKHLVETYLDFAAHLGITGPALNHPIPLKEEELQWIEKLTKEPYYVLHPKSSSKEKDWLLSRYIQVAKHVQDRYGLKLFITGGLDDLPICSKIEEALGGHAENLAGKTPLRHLSALISKARFLLTPDTGPAHIGSAFQTPVVGLYAATSPKVYGPYFSQNFVINRFKEGSMAKIETAEVIECIDLILNR